MAKKQLKRRDKAEKTECCVCLVFDVIRPALGAREGKMFCGAVLVFEKRAASGQFWRLFSEVVNDYFFANSLEDFFDELDVQGMNLVVVLDFFVGKDNVEGDLVALIDDGSFAGGHFAGVEVEGSRNGFQVLGDAVQQFLRGIGLFWIGPKDDNVRKHRKKFQPRRVV